MKRINKRQTSYEAFRDQARDKWGFVYFLYCTETCWSKIGWTTKHPLERLREIRNEFSNGFDWRLYGYVACMDAPGVEATLHSLFLDQRVTSKREWFVMSESQLYALGVLFSNHVPDFRALDIERAWMKGRIKEELREEVRHEIEVEMYEEVESKYLEEETSWNRI